MRLKTVRPSEEVVSKPADDAPEHPVVAEIPEVAEAMASVDASEPEDQEQTPAADDLYWAEVKLAGAMSEIERSRAQLEESIEDAKNLVDSASAELSKHETNLSNLKSEHKAKTQELLTLARKLMKLTDGKVLPKDEEEPTEEKTSANDGWRNAITAELLDGIKGLSKKKLDAIVEVAPTVGHLKDMRAVASQEHKKFHEVMPKGIGAGVASKIEDRVTEYIADWERRNDDPDRAQLADDLVAELRELATDWSKADCLPDADDDEHLHAGFSAFGAGKPHTDFLSEDRAKARSWMMGWVGAERLQSIEPDAAQQSA